MKRRIFFGLYFLLFFLDCRSTNLLRLFSGNLPAMFLLDLFTNKAWKLKVAESSHAKASLTKPCLATDEANRSPVG